LLWKELDDTIFALPKDQRVQAIRQKKDYIIGRLNADFQKPYIGKDGRDMDSMTYHELLVRMIELMYDAKRSRWLHETYIETTQLIAARLEERFIRKSAPSSLPWDLLTTDPVRFQLTVSEMYPESCRVVIYAEDVDYFLSVFRQRGRKPVPFVPVIDQNLSVWFKKDSLWQSEV
jgi:fatty acid synthase subunit beta